jgi:soluble lytic murein transglycosylase-like protein
LATNKSNKKGEKYLHGHHHTFTGENPGITRASLALTVFLLLLPNTARTDSNWWEQAPPPVVHGKVMPSDWWEEVKRSSERYHVNPFLVAAVAWIEGNGWDGDRIGHSPYWGPMGINEHCRRIPYCMLTDPLSNIRVGVAALQGNPQTVLKRYNATWYKNNYIRDVLALKRQLEREAMVIVRLVGKSITRDAS